MQIRNLTSQADGQPVAPATAKKRIYFSPEIVIMEMEAVSHLMDTSYAGQHNPATPGQGPAPRTRAGIHFVEEGNGLFEYRENN